MKTLCVFVSLFACGYGWGRGDLEKYGPFQLALRSNMIKCDHSRDLNYDVSAIDVWFYDWEKNEVRTFKINNASEGILQYRDLDKVKQFFVFVGGFKSHINKKTEAQIRETFRNYPNSYLIIIDHSAYTHDKDGAVKSYERSVRYVHYIGKAIAGMLAGLTKGGISPKSMRCIGHSLGSQILGQTGEAFHNITSAKISRITGLDPAGPCFSNSLTQEQIRSGVAEYVEVYHCNAGGLGTTSVLADTDFFVNKKGQSQPNCKTPLIPGIFDSPKAAKCSHRACVDIWTSTVQRPNWFPAYKCDSYKQFKDAKCSPNDITTAGFWNPGNATGVYYFSTEGYDVPATPVKPQ
ncbi:phospholipase A1 VesT1.02-like [Pectinophora gossypiella]|uniref:phospholipase A1 VesT1.02-like n=1 Tax=Pectinophora gossypiella TaxID=13191 RepID=UPI00214E6013|nr:phospholipase A1 VesT1.02-like [Pectinophora gossypiella]